MDNNDIFRKISHLETLLRRSKKILTLNELVDYIGFSKSTLNKKVQKRIIPSYNPNGKKLFFDPNKIDEWLLGGKTT